MRTLENHISYVDREPPSKKERFNNLWDNITGKFKIVRTKRGAVVYAPFHPKKIEENYLYVLTESKIDIDIELDEFDFKGGIKSDGKYNEGNRYIFPIKFTPATFWDGKYDFKITLKKNYSFHDIVRLRINNSKHEIRNFTVDGKIILDNGKIVENDDVYYYDSEIKTHVSIIDKIKNYFRLIFH